MNENIVWTVTVQSGWISLYFDFTDNNEAIKFAEMAAKTHQTGEYDFSVRVNATFANEVVKKEEPAEC